MKISENFLLRTVAGNTMAVPVGEASTKLNGMITLKNETAVYIWNCFCEETSVEDVSEKVQKKYDISSEDAKRSVQNFVDRLSPYGIFD